MKCPLRVLHIVSGDLWAGAEVQAFTLISHLAKMPDIEVAVALMNEGTLAQKLRAIDIPIWITDEKTANSLRIFIRLRGVLRSWRPDLIHTHREKENILGSLANRSCRNVSSVRTVHGGGEHEGAMGWRGTRHKIVTGVDRWCGRTLQQRVIAVSSDLGRRLARQFPPEKVIVIENGVDIEAVRAAQGIADFRRAEPQFVHVGIVGRLVKVKRVDLFIETAALLQRRESQRNWRFHVFGDGPLRAELERLSEGAALADRIRFHGHRHDIATCIAGLDALVICSDHEGLPMAALEAAALEVPTVAHAVGGLIDVVPEAFLVAQHDAQGYRGGILRTLQQDARAMARNHAWESLQKFSASRNAERIRSVYEQVIAEWHAIGDKHDARLKTDDH
ncbi:MAG: glycosyltransferase [Terriglobia bacterium]